MRVVLDTNVLVSSFFGGVPRKIISSWASGGFAICLCPEIIEEYLATLARFRLPDNEEFQELLAMLRSGPNVLFTSKLPKIPRVSSDEDDDTFIRCAVALDARYVVSGDSDLLEVGEYVGIRVLSPRVFLDELSA